MNTRLPAETFQFCGRTVGGSYKILEVLGYGGFGVVYRGVDTTSGTEYALKCVVKGAPDSSARRALSREWGMNKRIGKHPGVVRCHCAIEHGQFVFLVFDLRSGGDLFEHVTVCGTYFRNDALIKKAFCSLLDAVQHCHDSGVFHHDIKLENILCSPDGSELSLADFGLATMEEASEIIGVGSRDYQPPEALKEQLNLDEKFSVRDLDVWALGMVLINMVTSRNPWCESTTNDAAFKLFLDDPPRYLYETMPLSVDACLLFARVFDWNPYGRYSLDGLREAVMEVDTFFMSDEEFDAAPACGRDSLCHNGGAGEDQRALVAPVLGEDIDDNSSSSSSSSSMSSVTADFLENSVYLLPEGDNGLTPRPAAAEPSFNARTASSSAGPITPESKPVRDVDIEIVTMSLSSLEATSIARPGNPMMADLEESAAKHYEPSKKSVMRNAMRQMGLV